MYKYSILLFLIATLTGFFLNLIHFPLPWTLGPIIAAVIFKSFVKQPVYWPRIFRNLGMVFLGYLMGSPFTPAIAVAVITQLPVMLLTTMIIIVLCLGCGYIAGRFSGIGLANSLIGSIPGGLSQMSIICEETKGTDVAIVTLMQTVRMVTVVFMVPFLTLHGIADNVTSVNKVIPTSSTDWGILALFLAVIFLLIKFMRWLRLPNIYVIAPISGTLLLVLAGITAPPLPSPVIAAAQIIVAVKMGLDIEFSSLANWRSIAFSSLLSILTVISALLGVAFILSKLLPISLLTAFISMAPGGMSEMGLTAMMTNADLPTVVAYQLFRLLFVLLVCVPAARWWLGRQG